MESNEEETGITYDLTEILNYYKNKLSSNTLIFNGSEYPLRLFISIIIISSPLLIIWFFKDRLGMYTFPVYFSALIITVLFSLFVIINHYLKKNERELLNTKRETGIKAFFTLWSVDSFKIYQKKELRKYFIEKEITELPQYELLSKAIDSKLNNNKSSLIFKIGIPFSMLGTLWFQINQQIIKNVNDLPTLLAWGLYITLLIFSIWGFLNQALELHNIIVDTQNRRDEQLKNLVKEIIFDMEMKKHATSEV